MDAQHKVKVTLKSAQKTLRLISSLVTPSQFAKLLEENLLSETRRGSRRNTIGMKVEHAAIRRFFHEPHIMVSGYDADTLFYKGNSRDVVQLYLKSIVNDGVEISGNERVLQQSIDDLNESLKIELTAEIGGIFRNYIDKDCLFVVDPESLKSTTTILVQHSHSMMAIYFTLAITSCCSDIRNPMKIDDFFLPSIMFVTRFKMFSPDQSRCKTIMRTLLMHSA